MSTSEPSLRSGLNVLRCAVTGAATAAILFAVCWAGARLLPGQSHMAIALFTVEAPASVAALLQGLGLSVVFGAGLGAIVALVYNPLRFLGR